MYKDFFIQIGLMAVAKFLATYAMIASLAHFVFNLNTVYMTGLMVAPMAVIMLMMMRHMYKDPRMNMIIIAGGIILFLLCFLGIRTQTPIGDDELLRAMIPHHSGAILMCEQAHLTQPEVQSLCRNIIESQRREIAEMQAILARQR